MPNTTAHAPRSRAPNGAGVAGRFNIALLPAEHAQLKRLAETDGRTLSAMARVLVLRGIAETNQKEGASA